MRFDDLEEANAEVYLLEEELVDANMQIEELEREVVRLQTELSLMKLLNAKA